MPFSTTVPGSCLAPAACNHVPMAPPQALALPNCTVIVGLLGGLPSSLQSALRACWVHRGGAEVFQKRRWMCAGCARMSHLLLPFRSPDPAYSPGPHPHSHRTRLAPASIPPSPTRGGERDTSDDIHSPAHLVPIDVNKDGTGTSMEEAWESMRSRWRRWRWGWSGSRRRGREGARCLGDAGAGKHTLPLCVRTLPIALALAAAAAILKCGRLGVVDGFPRPPGRNSDTEHQRAPLLHEYSYPTAESSVCGALARSGADPRALRIQLPRRVPHTPSAARDLNFGGDENRVPPACAPTYGRIRPTTLGADTHSRVLLEMQMENARGGGARNARVCAYTAYPPHDEPRHQNLAKTPPTPKEFILARFGDIDCSTDVVLNINRS
ncbi:hypothetical protein B0H13DRAFT_2555911 [Mycena leptocephala]|nr:hypothetical protein B0H13DRAFT_2555911 [Mycena leptocephala]